MSGKIVIISGPSCAGKDTTIDEWMSFQPLAQRVVTCTTRAPREGEIEGVHYHFLSEEDFQQKVDQGDYFLEHMLVHDKWYGTSREALDKVVSKGGYAIVRIDVQGAMEIMPKLPEAITIFINAPSIEEIERRMRAVRKATEEEIQLRLKNAVNEIECSKHYQHYLINSSVKETAHQIDEIVTSEAYE